MTLSNLRIIIQFLSTILSNSYIGSFYTKTINSNPLKSICVPFLNCYACPSALFSCPIGTCQHFITLHQIPYFLIGYMGIIGIFVGRMACGWLCPFGFIQDLLFKIKSKKYELMYQFKYIKYAVFIVFVIMLPYYTGDLWFSILCPAGKLIAGIPWVIWNPSNPETNKLLLPDGPGFIFYFSILIMLGFLGWFIVCKRPFCRTVCPVGTFFSFFNSISLIKLELTGNCDNCSLCKKNCPMDLDVSFEINSGECIRCLECTKCDNIKVKKNFNQFFRLKEDV